MNVGIAKVSPESQEMKKIQISFKFCLIPIFLFPAFVAFLVQIQGFNLLDDGLWLLGTRTIARGGVLYRDIFSIYGPMKYFFLFPFFIVFGESIRTLIIFKAVVTGAASVLGFFVVRRYGAKELQLLVPVALLALGPVPLRYVCAAAFAVLLSEIFWGKNRKATRGVIIGLAWGFLAFFGLDMMVYATIILTVGPVVAHTNSKSQSFFDLRRDVGILIGISTTFLLSIFVAGILGILDSFIWDTIICPLSFSPNHIGPSFFDGLIRLNEFGPVFSQVFTGESLAPAWPGHTLQRQIAILTMTALVILIPIGVLIFRRKNIDPRIGPVLALALAGWVTILWRSDIAHLMPAFYGTLLLVACLLKSTKIFRVPSVLAAVVLLAITLGPFAGENAWLIVNRNRPALVNWNLSTAKVAIARDRRDTLEMILDGLGDHKNEPTIAWPAHPGIVFLSEKPMATSQITLLAGGVQNPLSVIEDLQKNKPSQLVVGRVAGLAPGERSMQSLAPSIWSYLRTHFFIEHQFADGAEGFQIIRSLASVSADLQAVPLERQLPGSVQLVKNSVTPAISPATQISQILKVGGLDFRGITLLVAAKGRLPAEFEMEIQIEELFEDGKTKQLGIYGSQLFLSEKIQHCSMVFPPIPQTAGKTIIVTFSVAREMEQEIRLLWHDSRIEGMDSVDYYPEGYSLLNGNSVNADLYFISY